MKAAILSTCGVLTITGAADSKNMVIPARKHLSLVQTIKWQKKIIRHDRWVLRTHKLHTARAVTFASHQLKWTKRELRSTLRSLHSTQQYGMPSHHALWDCISKYEGSPTSVNPNGHYGMLQMHWDWGYGIKGAASNYSKTAQEQAAERAYKASNYSTSFLWGQWFNYDNAEGECLKYA